MLNRGIARLVSYGVRTGLIPEEERIYTTNLLLDVFHETEYTEPEDLPETDENDLEDILRELLEEAVKRGLTEDSVVYRDLFDTRLMNCLVPRPAQVQSAFRAKYEKSPQEATVVFSQCSRRSTPPAQKPGSRVWPMVNSSRERSRQRWKRMTLA